ncbi:MAG: DUF262 domain-containing protein [Phormidesmis sp.]
MPSDRLLETQNTRFGELFGNGRRYKVPAFQRDYAWTIENWEDLWQDILIAHQTQSLHFMGAIVTQTAGGTAFADDGNHLTLNNTSLIIDGQQRLVTLSILAIAVIDKIQQLAEEGVEAGANQKRQEILRRTYLGDRDPGSLRYSSKLSLNENDDGFYQNNLVNLRQPKYISVLTQSEQLLWGAFTYFSNQLTLQEELSRSGTSLATLLSETVARRLLFIQISAEDGNNAYVLFETLNSRGVELGSVDLLKNYIFSLLRGPDDHNAARHEWQQIVRTVGMKDFPSFLNCFLQMTSRQRKRTSLFKSVRQSITNAEQAFNLLETLSDYSNLYVALNNSNDDLWRGHSKSKQVMEWVRQLNLLGTSQFQPALLAASEKFDDGKFEKLLKMMAVLAFRYVVSGLNPNDLERHCGALAVAISKGKVKSPKAAFAQLSSLYVADEKFHQDFSVLSISNQQQKGLIKYILRQLEKQTSGKDVIEDSFSIEHILPQNPDESWQKCFERANPEAFIYRIGNMTLLEPNLNSALGRAVYQDKQQIYSNSSYAMTQSIQADEWTATSIINRQDRMAAQAVQIWQLNDYAR